MTIKTTWTADAKQANRAVDSMVRKTQKYEDELHKLTGKSMTAAQAMQRASKRTVKDGQEAVAVIQKEEQRQISLREKIAQVIAEKELQKRKERELGQAARNTGAAMTRQTTHAHGGMMKMMGTVSMLTGGYISMMGAIMAVTNAIQEMNEAREKSEETAAAIADPQKKAIAMLADQSAEGVKKYKRTVQQITQELFPTGGEPTVHTIMVDVLSAAGGNLERAQRATVGALKMQPHDPEIAKAIAAGAIDLEAVLGRQADALTNLGFLMGAVKGSRIVTPSQLAKYSIPAVMSITSTGADPKTAFAFFNAFGKAIADKTGRLSSTGAPNAAKALAELMPEKDVYKYALDPTTDRVSKILVRKGTGIKTLGERLKKLQSDRELQERWIAQYVQPAPAKTRGAWYALAGVHPIERINEAYAKTFAESFALLPNVGPESRAMALKQIKAAEPLPEEKIARAKERSAVFEQTMQAGTPLGRQLGKESPYRWEKLNKQLLLAGDDVFTRTLAWLEYKLDITKTPQQAYESAMEAKIAELRRESPVAIGPSGFSITGGRGSEADLTLANQLEDYLQDMREIYGNPRSGVTSETSDKLGEKMDRLSDAVEQQTDIIRGNSPEQPQQNPFHIPPMPSLSDIKAPPPTEPVLSN